MPIYEYRCESCRHQLEALQKLSDPTLTDCPACQQPALKRLISPVGFRLKGGGWYETDFKSGNKRNLAEDGKTDTKTSASEDTTNKTPSKDKAKSDTANTASPAATTSSSTNKPSGSGGSAAA